MPPWALSLELVLLFFVLPLAFRFSPVRIPALPALWLVCAYALWQLLRDSGFDRLRMWNFSFARVAESSFWLPFLMVTFFLWLGVRRLAPQLEWSFARAHPAFWAVVMIAYPILSVYPQGLLYRAFFFQRYAVLFPERWTMILASAIAFAFLHIIFRNTLAVALTFVGGILFAWRYAETGSLAVSSLEHALYGCWLFTVGLGGFFYHGTIAGSVLRK